MMKDRRRLIILIFMALLSIAALIVVQFLPSKNPEQNFSLKLRAALLMQESMKVIYDARISQDIPVDLENDPNKTGLIGPEYSEFTTTLGPLEVKRTTTNPDFAAVIVQLLQEAGVKKGDLVAAGISGSFPGLALALFSAAEVMELDLAAISSVGASTFGATHPLLTWLDMETLLFQAGLISKGSSAASVGGDDDQLKNPFFPGASEMALEAIRRNGVHVIARDTLEEAMETRVDFYMKQAGDRRFSAFINIGGAEVNLGTGDAGYSLPSGVIKKAIRNPKRNEGIIFRMAEEGIPVINLLNVRDLCLRYGLPVDPVPLPTPGNEGIYYIRESSLLPLLVLLILSIAIGILIWTDKKIMHGGRG